MTGSGDAVWRRLSRRMLLVHPVVEIARAVPAIAGALLAGGASSGSVWAAGIALVVGAFGTLRYFTTRYRIGPAQIQLKHGIVRRRELSVPLDRVRTVDVTAHVLHRLLGIARVAIGTGTSDRKDHGDRLVLDGLTAQQAARLRSELLHRTPPAGGPVPDAVTILEHDEHDEPADEKLVELDPRWLRYAPFTLTGALTGLALLGVGWRIVSESHVRLDRVSVLRDVVQRFERWSPLTGVIVATAGVIAFVAVASTAGYLLSFWRFVLSRNDAGSLQVSRGLLTSRTTSIERRRLVGVELSEPMLLRWAGGARVLAVATGLRVGRGGERGGEILLPPAPRSVAIDVAAEVSSRGAGGLTMALPPHPRAALPRRVVRTGVPALAILALTALVVWASGGPGWIVLLAASLPGLAVPLAVDRYRSLGHALVDAALVVGAGSLVRTRTVLDTEAVIGWTLRSSWFQRRAGLVTLIATTAAGRQKYVVSDLAAGDAIDLADSATPGLLTEFLTPSCPRATPSDSAWRADNFGGVSRTAGQGPAAGRAAGSPPPW